MLVVLVLVALVGLSIGLMISALVRTSEVAVAVLPLILLPMVISGGAIKPLPEIKNAPTRLWTNMMPSRWAFESMLLLESEERGPLDGIELAAKHFPRDEHRTSVTAGIVALTAMRIITAFVNAAILRRRDVHQA